MAEAARVSEHGGDHRIHEPSLFECCRCHSSNCDLLLLSCLHNYCRPCFDSSASRTLVLKATVTCPACTEVTEISTVLTNNFLSTYKRASAIRAEIVWCNTCEKTAKWESAELWCVVCAGALCAACYVQHNRSTNGHRIFELEHARTLPLGLLTKRLHCNLHKRPIETHCFTCHWPKCTKCLESCADSSHDWNFLSDERSQEHISCVTTRVRNTAERLGSVLSGILQKCRAIASRLPVDRISGFRMLGRHRRRLHDSTLLAFDESAGEVCRVLQSTRLKRLDLCARITPRSCAANVEALARSDVRSLHLLGAKILIKTLAAGCYSSCGASIRRVLQRCEEIGSISIYGSLPLTSDVVLSVCLGYTDCRRAAPPSPLQFGQASVCFKTPVFCYDLAATRDGHVLLAAAEHGLLVYSDGGQHMSSWRPARQSDGRVDQVSCVAALHDGRAAVGVFWARLVVLLKQSDTGHAWLEDRRVVMLHTPPDRLAVHGDLLAAAEVRRNEQQQGCVWGREVKLLRLSSGQLLYTLSRGYDIYSIERVALTALCLLTTSLLVTRNSRAWPYVLDAFSHSGEFLWRYETSDEEVVTGLCVSADSWSRVYVTVERKDESSSTVMAIEGADGRDCREVLSSGTHGLQSTGLLSLARGQQRTVLALLSCDTRAKQFQSVSLYEATVE